MRSGSSVVSPDVAAGSSRLADPGSLPRLLPAVRSGHVRLVLHDGAKLLLPIVSG